MQGENKSQLGVSVEVVYDFGFLCLWDKFGITIKLY
jgi:hypothetical protein